MLRSPRLVRALLVSFTLWGLSSACTGRIDAGSGSPGDGPQPGGGGGSSPGKPGSPSQAGGGVTGQFTLGPIALRRLNAVEYENTVVDLLGAKPGVTASFTADDPALGYTNQAAALQVTPLLAEQYYAAANKIAEGVEPNAIAPCAAKANQGSCADTFITSLGRKLYRRPLTDAERSAYRTVFDGKLMRADWAGAVRLVVRTMLQSPHFLYKTEIGSGTGADRTLTNYEVATQIAYLVTGHPPDAILSAAADAGSLSMPSERVAHINRLLKNGASVPWLTTFVSQWLGIQGVTTIGKDAKSFPAYTAATRAAVQEQANRFIASVLTDEAGSIETLFSANWTFANKDLGSYFGMDLPTTWQKVQMPASERLGILTQPAFLVATSKADDSYAIRRGKTLRMRVLCGDLPPPPPDVKIDPVVVNNKDATARERLAQHEKAGSVCASCHKLFDPLGLAFETYDAVGSWRTMDAGKPIDASGTIAGIGTEVDGPVTGAIDFVKRIATSDTLKRCASREVTRWALGRGTVTASGEPGSARDQAILDLVFAKIKATGDVRSAITALVERDEFLLRSDR